MSAALASASPLMTDERLAHLTPWGLILVAALLVVALIWTDRGRPWVDDAEPEPEPPSLAPDIADIEVRSRAADRG